MNSEILFPTPKMAGLLRAQLEAVLNGGNTARFHTVSTIRRNTVGQHSYGVAMLCFLLTQGNPSKQLLMAALTHDIAEQWTGDIPAPAKRALGIRAEFGRIEDEVLGKLALSFPTDANDTIVLKLADAMDGMLFCINERRLGNTHVEAAFDNFSSYVKEQSLDEEQRDIFETIHHMWSRVR